MADEDLRELERAWRASPKDGELATRYVAALRRAGRSAPREALAARVLPPRTIRTSVPIEVSAWLGGAQLPKGSTEGGRAVELPAHSGWRAHVEVELGAAALERLADELVELQVEQLSLNGTPGAADEGPLVRLLERLRTAPLAGFSTDHRWPLPAPVLEALASLPRLTTAYLRLDAGVDVLARAPWLSNLILYVGEAVTDAQLEALSGARALETLWLKDARISFLDAQRALTGSFVEALPPGVRELDLDACRDADDATLGRAVRLPALRMLHLGRRLERVTDAGLERLAGSALEDLWVGSPGLGDRALRALSGLSLRRLAVNAPFATRTGWAALPATLEELDVTVEAGEPRAWAGVLPGKTSLRKLCLEGSLSEAPHLDLAALFVVPGLSSLNLDWVRAEPTALRELARHPGLRSVQLGGDGWTDRHVAALEAFERLEAVSLFLNADVSDRALTSLARCRALRRLELIPRTLTRGAVERFRRDRPDVVVEVLGDLQPDPPAGWLARLLGRG